MSDPLGDVFAFVERSYWRIQAGDVLMRCMEEGRIAPLERMVEALVLDGPHNLGALQEILDEVNLRRQQVEEDLRRLLLDLQEYLTQWGLSREDAPVSASPLEGLSRLLLIPRQEDTPPELQRMLRNTREVAAGLEEHLRLLVEIERLLEDWLWGMAYQSARRRDLGPAPPLWVQ